jgi:hypothetical protein
MCDLEILFDITKEQQKILKFNEEQEKEIDNLKNIKIENKNLNVEIKKKDYYDNNIEEYKNLYFLLFKKYNVLSRVLCLYFKQVPVCFNVSLKKIKNRFETYFNINIIKTEQVINLMFIFNFLYVQLRINEKENRHYFLKNEKLISIINYYVYLYLHYPEHNEFEVEIDNIKNFYDNIDKETIQIFYDNKLEKSFLDYFKFYIQVKYESFNISEDDNCSNTIANIYTYINYRYHNSNKKEINDEFNKINILYNKITNK